MFNIIIGIIIGVATVAYWPEILFFLNDIGVCK